MVIAVSVRVQIPLEGDSRGAFLIKKAGEKIAQLFEISKFTLYNYLEESRTDNDSTPI